MEHNNGMSCRGRSCWFGSANDDDYVENDFKARRAPLSGASWRICGRAAGQQPISVAPPRLGCWLVALAGAANKGRHFALG